MVKYLVIVESPTKEKTLKKILGKNYIIKSSRGHIIDLPKTKLGIDIEYNFQPEYVTIPRQRSIVKELEKYSKDKEKIFLATDPDREGEAIAWHIAQKLKIKDDNNRVSFNEITERAVSHAFKNPREINLNMIESQKTRRLLDRLVGYKISPLLWNKIGKKLSAGRVQSVALRLICEREEEIKKFKEQEYWLIDVLLKKIEDIKSNSFEAKLFSVNSKKITIKDKNEAMQICDDVRRQEIYVKNAQQLYEGIILGEKGSIGLITYMRTDSLRVSDEAKNEAKKYIEEKYGKEFARTIQVSKKRINKIKNKNIQDAHESIRPTSIFNYPELIKKYLKNDQYKLYNLIWRRFIASRMKAAYLEKISVDIESGKYIFRASGVKVLFKGFMIIYDKNNEDLRKLPTLKEGDKLELSQDIQRLA